MALVRTLVGDQLRAARVRQGRTLRQVATDAGVSLGYLSEVERGRKEASSELLWAISNALSVPLSDLYLAVGEELRLAERSAVAGVTNLAGARRTMVAAA